MFVLTEPLSMEGEGVHTGRWCRVTLVPWNRSRLDQALTTRSSLWSVRLTPSGSEYEVRPVQGEERDRMSCLRFPEGRVLTPEHLLATLMGMEIGGVTLVVEGPEVPILDGSARPWVRLLNMAIKPYAYSWPSGYLDEPFECREGEAYIKVHPSSELTIEYSIDFPHPLIRQQTIRFHYSRNNFIHEISPARTFGFYEQADSLRNQGLALGAGPENTVIFKGDGILNPPLRFPDEPVRHKILDMLGDLALLGGIRPCVRIEAYRGGHRLHLRMVRELFHRIKGKTEDKS